ncbi:MAG: Ig-like domain-containing protein [Defluviitaleaceae bacterium]|nr:Ig-like domain-containing protein [Defluviitaleaceae bacterium]
MCKWNRKMIMALGVAVAVLVASATVFIIWRVGSSGGYIAKQSVPSDGGASNIATGANGLDGTAGSGEANETAGPGDAGISLAFAPGALGNIRIEPVDGSAWGVELQSAFMISSDAGVLTEAHLLAYLTVYSGEEFTLRSDDGGAFLLELAQPLAYNRLIRFVYAPTGYAPASVVFQTVDTFGVVGTTPADRMFEAPVGTGIEIEFNRALAGNFADFFEINPAVEGQFLQRGDTHIFAPSQPLEWGVQYTVTVRQGVQSVLGEVLPQDFEFIFRTRWLNAAEAPFSLMWDTEQETFLPWHEVFIALRGVERTLLDSDFVVTLYDMYTAENYLAFVPGGDLGTKIATFELAVTEIPVSEWHSFFYLFLGETLPEGFYVVVVESTCGNTEHREYKRIQVSALSVYTLFLQGEALVWVHDASTGLPAAGAQVSIGGERTVADDEGIAIIATVQDNNAPIHIVYGSHMPFVYTHRTYAPRPLMPADRFLVYMYTDRPMYRPQDMIDVFGIILPRYGHAHCADDVFTLHIGDMIEQVITLDAMHYFAVRVPVTGLFGWPHAEVRVNGEPLMSAWFQVFDYVNHRFVFDGSLNGMVFEEGDTVHADIELANFAGMPMEGIVLQVGNIQRTTDAHGHAEFERVLRMWEVTNWVPEWNTFMIHTSGEQAWQGFEMPFITMSRDIMMESTWRGNRLELRTYEILPDALRAYTGVLRQWDEISADIFRGAPVAVDYTIEITRWVTTRTLRSEHYDHINRRMVRTYNHNTVGESYRTLTGTTTNGRATINNFPVSDDPLIRFSAVVRYNDRQGRTTQVHVGNQHPHYHTPINSTIRRFHFDAPHWRLRVDETMRVSLTEGNRWFGWNGWVGEVTPVTGGRALAVLVRDGILSTSVGTASGVDVTFTEAGISHAFLLGAYFDGQRIFPISQLTIQYDYMERALDIELTACKAIYRPGDEVTLTIRSAPDAAVVISVVDESAFQGHLYEVEILQRLFGSNWWWVSFSQFTSFRQHEFGEWLMDEGWGGGGDDPGYHMRFRDTFIDNPVFESVRTDAYGYATLTFTLPDQVTAWRVTALGMHDDDGVYRVGSHRLDVISFLDFYVDLLLTTEYIVGDEIAAVARVHGAVGEDATFVFSVLYAGEEIFTDTVTGQRRAEFNAGILPTGEYVMRVTATAGDFYDAVELPFTVAYHVMIIENRVQGVLSPDAPFVRTTEGMRDLPVRVTLHNARTAELMAILPAPWGISYRTDYLAAAAFWQYFRTGEADFAAVRNAVHFRSGGIPQLLHASCDFFYTARFVASLPDMVNHNQILMYMRERTDFSVPMARAARLLALAALGEPVLLEIYEEIAELTEDHYFAWLYLVAALVAIGDHGGAMMLYTQNAQTLPPGASRSNTETSAVLRFFIHTVLDPTAALVYLNRAEANRYMSDVPERIHFVRQAHLAGDIVSYVQYTLHGTTRTVQLAGFARYSLQISQAQFGVLDLTALQGETAYQLTFYSYGHAHWDAAQAQINVTRTVTRVGERYRIAFTITLPPGLQGAFTVHDRIPSNMRFALVQTERRQVRRFSVNHVQRQLVDLHFYVGIRDTNVVRVYYYATRLFGGEMAAGTSYVVGRNARNFIWGMTE